MSAVPSGPMTDFDMGRVRWQLELPRCRGAEANSWTVEACDASSYLAVPAPTWTTDRLRRRNGGLPPPEVPLAASQQGSQRLIASVDQAARRLKLRPGMAVAHAQSLVPDLVIQDAMPAEDEAGLTRLALWCTRYSPLVTPDPPDGVFIDVAGSAYVFKGEAALLHDLKVRMAGSRIEARAAVADTPACAWAAARFSKEEVVAPGRASDVLGALPIEALRLDRAIVESLRDVGIERIAQLATKPRGGLRTRFGAAVLLRMDQALGAAVEVLTALVPPKCRAARCDLPSRLMTRKTCSERSPFCARA